MVEPVGAGEEREIIWQAAHAINKQLPPDQQVTLHQNTHAAVSALIRKRFFTIQGLGLLEDSAYLREVPGFLPLTSAEISQMTSGVEALLAESSRELRPPNRSLSFS